MEPLAIDATTTSQSTLIVARENGLYVGAVQTETSGFDGAPYPSRLIVADNGMVYMNPGEMVENTCPQTLEQLMKTYPQLSFQIVS